MAAAEDERRGEMIYRTLGRTGEKVSAIGLGGSHIGQMKDGQMKDGQMKDGQMRDGQDAIRLVRKAIDRGLTFMDNSWDYNNGNGQGEIKMWKALRDGCRQKTFPMTKVDGRTKDSAAGRLTNPSSGCRPTMFPNNVMDAHFRSCGQAVLRVAQKKNLGILCMKPPGSGIIMKSGTVSAMDRLHFVLTQPVSVCINGCEKMADPDQAFEAVRTFRPMNPRQVPALPAQTKDAAAGGKFELFKTGNRFDSTAKNPAWLG